MTEILHLEDRVYVLSTSALVDDRRSVMKRGETFAIFNRRGDIQGLGLREQGIFHEGTRFLSRWELFLQQLRPLLLGSMVTRDNCLLAIDLMNPDLLLTDGTRIRHGNVHLFRTKILLDGAFQERIKISNYSHDHLQLTLTLRFEADFVDIFEVRGMSREKRGIYMPAALNATGCVLSYEGLDGIVRQTELRTSPAPEEVSASEIQFKLEIPPQQARSIDNALTFVVGRKRPDQLTYEHAYELVCPLPGHYQTFQCKVDSSNDQFKNWVSRSIEDLQMLITETSEGPYPYAGIPWFSAPFGRDGILTALMILWVNPAVAKGVLAFLAARQGREVDARCEEEPGKILHEWRTGEMAATGEVPFGFYYGSIDATPLFLMLAAAYDEMTADTDFMLKIWPSILAALDWIDSYGDIDGDGLYEYVSHNPSGLVQQGWKDSNDSVSHRNGELAQPPIALCEVQGYVYAAKQAIASLAQRQKKDALAQKLREEASELREKFHNAFWCEEIGMYALALDGEKKQCRVRSSNAGHALFCGIAKPEYAARVGSAMFETDMYSGWGIRTLSSREVNYNPIAYHNGSIWPHDNALIAYGLARYQMKELACKLFDNFMDVASGAPLSRLPELFCGFERRPGQDPTLHPVACSPQAWAAASVLCYMQALLGLTINGWTKNVTIQQPALPSFLSDIYVNGLQVGEGKIDLSFHRLPEDVSTHVVKRSGGVGVTVVK